MRIGVMLPMSVSDGGGRMPSWSQVRAVARHAESAGLDSAWVCDHLLSEPPGRPVEGIAEAWTLLSALAASTKRLTVGTMVTPTVSLATIILAAVVTLAAVHVGASVANGAVRAVAHRAPPAMRLDHA